MASRGKQGIIDRSVGKNIGIIRHKREGGILLLEMLLSYCAI